MNKKPKIVGIGGLPRSGKDTLAEVFMDNDYFGFSFGDYNREFSRKRHADKPDPISVANMTETSNWLRETHGADVILRAGLDEFEKKQSDRKAYKGLVFFSIRAPIEVDWILEKKGQLIWVETSDEIRHKRALANLREGEKVISFAEFKAQEALQWQPQPGIPKESQMDIKYTKNQATIILENNGDNLAKFCTKAKELL